MKPATVSPILGSKASSAAAAILLLCFAYTFAYTSDTRAQSVPQKAPAITFHVYQANAPVPQGESTGDSVNGNGDGTQMCCNVASTLTSIPPCNLNPIVDVKGGQPLAATDSCCCVDLDVYYNQNTDCITPVCGVDIVFDNGAFNPLCNVCSLPPGWTYSLDVPYNGTIHLRYSGSDCSGVLNKYGQHLHFQFCGQNASGAVCYHLNVYMCIKDPTTGKCVASTTPFCSPPFCNDLSCNMGSNSVASTNHSALTIDAGYPNPAASSIRFGFSSEREGQMSMTLVDLLGRTISTSSTMVSNGDGTITIDLAGAQPGAYYCVFDMDGQRLTRRIQIK